VQLGDRTHDGEPQPGALPVGCRRSRVIRAVEPLEDVRQRLLGDARSRVGDAGVHSAILAKDVDVHIASRRGVPDPVRNQVPDEPADQIAIACHRRIAGPRDAQAHVLFLRAAAEPLPVPLVCTEGQPSIACDRLLRSAAGAGVRILWRNDFDWDGVRMTAAALTRYAAEPWRMGVDDYCAALEGGDSEPLKGAAVAASWDAALSAAMAQEGRAIMEERLIPRLLDDLRRGCPP